MVVTGVVDHRRTIDNISSSLVFPIVSLKWPRELRLYRTRIVFRPQSSAEYRCEASNWAGRRNATVFVEVLDTNVTAYCKEDGVWPLTGAGKSASVECPKNRSTSYASRTCVLTADNVTEWQTSDYSHCTPDELNKITLNVSKRETGSPRCSCCCLRVVTFRLLLFENSRPLVFSPLYCKSLTRNP